MQKIAQEFLVVTSRRQETKEPDIMRGDKRYVLELIVGSFCHRWLGNMDGRSQGPLPV
jgi:hypothetical protein